MAMHDNLLGGFAADQSLTGTADVVSTNVYDALTAIKQFAGEGGVEIEVRVTASGGTSPTFRARFVAADDAALTSNPIILSDTGVSTVLTAGDLPWTKVLKPRLQKTAKRYYGIMFTQSGTNPTATVDANCVLPGGAQTAGLE